MYRIIFILILLIVLYFLLRSAFREFGKGNRKPERLPRSKDQMVQDPVCRVFVPRGSAVIEVIGGQTYCFCSPGCAAAFQKQMTG
jgi:YHS domain-containing protein